jgi:type II secretory pathway component GspD/PulD (secretin)
MLLSFCMLLLSGVCLAQPVARPEHKVTLDVTDQPSAEVMAEVGRQIEAQVAFVGPNLPEKVTLRLQDAAPDEAVARLAEALEASWMRAYVLESQPPPTPYTGDQLFDGLENQRNNWVQSLTPEQHEALVKGVLLAPRPAPGETPSVMPGAGRAKWPAGPSAALLGRYDAVRNVTLPQRTECVTLTLQDTPLPQALFAVTTASGFLVAAGGGLGGNITLTAEQQPLEQVIAEIAPQANAQWRPIYLLSIPRDLSAAETDQKIEQGMQRHFGQFWAKTPDARAEEVQNWVGRLGKWGEMAKQPTADGRPNMVARAIQTLGPKVLSHLVEYSSGLPPAQRKELTPLIQALGKAVAGQ